MLRQVRRIAVVGVACCGLQAVSCGSDDPPSLAASVVVLGTDRDCVSPGVEGSTCQITARLRVSIRETAGEEVVIQSVSAALWDRRGMQNMRAEPAELSSEDVRAVAGSNTVAGRGELSVPYALTFSLVEPYILGPLEAVVHVEGRGRHGDLVSADSEGM